MQVLRASILGYCMGVRRAVSLAQRELQPGVSGQVYTMGPLIHNPQVLEDLKNQGMKTLEETALPGNLQGARVIIRAHGISPDLEASLIRRGTRLVDATCPKVKASQMKVREFTARGYQVFLAGEKHHGELIGIQGYGSNCLVLADAGEAAVLAEGFADSSPWIKTVLLGQTTISSEEYGLIGEAVRRFFPDLEIIDTICGATKERQEALKELCGNVDALVVVGGKESANTRRLLSIAQAQGKPAWLVESPRDIPPEAGSYPRVGLSAGASSPDALIDQIEMFLYQL